MVADENVGQTILTCLDEEKSIHQVIRCDNGKEAMEILKHQSIQLIMLDAETPGVNGYEMLKYIQEKYGIPTVYITSDKNLKTLRQVEALGADDYLTKPFLPMELNEIVHSILEN